MTAPDRDPGPPPEGGAREGDALRLLDRLAAEGCRVDLRRGEVVLRPWPARPLPDGLRAEASALEGALRAALERDRGLAGPRVEPSAAPAGAAFPLTDLQRAYYVGEAYFDALRTPAYVATGYRVAAGREAGLRGALLRVMARHPMLRARAVDLERQEIAPPDDAWDLTYVDAAGAGPDGLEAAFRREAEAVGERLPPLERGPQLAAVLVRGERECRLVLAVRLFVLDALSISLVYRELERQLGAAAPTHGEARLGFADFARALARYRDTQGYRNSIAYWTRRLDELPAGPELPAGRGGAGAAGRARFARRRFRLGRDQWQRLQARARAAGLTPNAVLCTCYADALRKWSSRKAFCLTVLASLRASSEAADELASVVGNFGTTGLVAFDGAPGPFVERARRAQDQMLAGLEHGHVSAIEVLRLQRRAGRAAGDNVPFVFASGLGAGDGGPHYARVGGWQLAFQAMRTPQVLIDHQVFEEDGELFCNFDYVPDAFPEGLVDELVAYHEGALGALADDEAAWSRPAPPPLPAELLAGRRAANRTERPLAPSGLDRALRRAFRERPDAVAIAAEGESLTYGEARARVAALAARLRAQGVGPGDVVGVLARKGAAAYLAAVAVVWLGAAYLPLNEAWPAARIAGFVEHCGARVVVADGPGRRRLEGALAAAIEPAPEGAAEAEGLDLDALPENEPGRLAYVIFTSGSTGVPKATAIAHGAAWNTVADVLERFGVDERDRVLAISELSFDLSVFDLFGTLGAGATLVVPAPSDAPAPERWAECVRAHRVTVWNSVPALLELVLDALGPRAAEALASLRLVLLSGDWVPVGLPARLREAAPGARVVALGGATEASIWSNYHEVTEVPAWWESIPYGRPLANQRFHALDEAFEPVPNWVPGELYIAGDGLALGYYRQPELTARAFFTPPTLGEPVYRTGDYGRYWPDGTLEFLGRRDAQVKVRGYRLDLREIEQCLCELPGVRAAVCLAHGEGARRALVAFFVPREGEARPPDARALAAAAAERLPRYAVPDRFVAVNDVPLTPNGKRDTRALLARLAAAPPGGEALSADERRLAALWASACGVEVASGDADFFAAGGNSILAVRLVGAINRAFGLALAPAWAFEHRTLREQAELVRAPAEPTPGRASLVALRRGGPRPTVVLVHPVGGTLYGYDHLVRALPADWTLYGLRCPPVAAIPPTLAGLAARYADELRGLGRPVHLLGWSMGGVLGLEIARQLAAEPCRPRSLTLIDSYVRTAASPRRLSAGQAMAAFVGDYLAGQGRPASAPPPDEGQAFGAYVEALKRSGHLPADLPGEEFAQIFAQFERLYALLLGYDVEKAAPERALFVAAARREPDAERALEPVERVLDASAADRLELDFDHHTIVRPGALAALVPNIEAHVRRHD
ncbi:MAG TPA: amino acid adenylation domain-containing protein [Polyangiaceae bacterium]|nr:amino acid adenylation domain-containing protein [Polyangiaceae bacterium]